MSVFGEKLVSGYASSGREVRLRSMTRTVYAPSVAAASPSKTSATCIFVVDQETTDVD